MDARITHFKQQPVYEVKTHGNPFSAWLRRLHRIALNYFKETGQINDPGNAVYDGLYNRSLISLTHHCFYDMAKETLIRQWRYKMFINENCIDKTDFNEAQNMIELLQHNKLDFLVEAEAKNIALKTYFEKL